MYGMLNMSLSCHNVKTVKSLIHATPFMMENSEEKWLHHIFRENTFTFISAPTPLWDPDYRIWYSTVTRLQGRGCGVQIPVGARDSFPKLPDQLWCPPSLLFNGCLEFLLLGGKVAGA